MTASRHLKKQSEAVLEGVLEEFGGRNLGGAAGEVPLQRILGGEHVLRARGGLGDLEDNGIRVVTVTVGSG